MAKMTLAQVKATRLPSVANLSPNDSRFTALVNEAQQRLLTRGKWFGTCEKMILVVDAGLIVWPRRVAAIEAMWSCSQPVTLRNEWFETLQSSFGLHEDESSCGGLQLYDRGTAPTFKAIDSANKKLRVYTDVTEAAGAKILLQGFDENNNRIRTLVSGTYIDGEYVALTGTPVLSTKIYSSVTAIQKPVTKGFVRLYEYDTVATTQRVIGIYEPDETIPNYRRSLLGGWECLPENDDGDRYVTILAKLDFIPVVNDTDYLIIGNISALKDEIQSILKSENNLFQEAIAWETKAVNELQRELSAYRGSGVVVPIRVADASISGFSGLNIL